MTDLKLDDDAMEDRLDLAIRAVLAESPPAAAGTRTLEAAAAWAPDSLPSRVRSVAPRPWHAPPRTLIALVGAAAALLVAVSIITRHFGHDGMRSLPSVADGGDVATPRHQPAGPAAASTDDAVSPEGGEDARDEGAGTVIHAAPYLIPNVGAHVASRAPILVANGGPNPLHLGTWRESNEAGGVMHVWNWAESPMSRIVKDGDGKEVELWAQSPVRLSPDGRFVVWQSGEILDLTTGLRSTIDLEPEKLEVLGLKGFSPDGNRLALSITHLVEGTPGQFDRQAVRIVEFPSGMRLCEFPFVEENAMRFCFSPDGTQITAVDFSNKVVRRDATTGQVLREYRPLVGGQVLSIDVSPDGRLTAAVERTGDVLLWDTESGGLMRRIAGSQLRDRDEDLQMARFSPDGRYLAVASWERLSVVDVATGEVDASLHESAGLEMQWSDDGRAITVITPVAIGELPTGDNSFWGERYDAYPSVYVWDWRQGTRIESLTSEPPK